ncbi:CBS domain-containing protein [Halosquirtibacter laminarini]|uniref:CBS domain-containing protein n=1 Tax=Halosquirtibacter laminarini TaxID=3374600 RepID=A0AC61NK54_9BACT|nr:CBS domain-containing protein [Prolixibacteraceae bacterium]
MIAKDLIEGSIPTLSEVDNGLKALSIMECVGLRELPVIQGSEYIGLMSEDLLLELEDLELPFDSFTIKYLRPHVHLNQHLFEIIGLMIRLRTSVIPVLDDQHQYVGAVGKHHIMERMCDVSVVKDPGAIIVFEMPSVDYSSSEIAQIIEENNARILSLFVTRVEGNPSHILVTIKVNVVDVTSIVATFERYTYKIKGIYNDDSRVDDLYHDRYEEFMKYMDL